MTVSGRSDHAGARAALAAAAPGRSRAWLQAVQAVAHSESGYGFGFRAAAAAGLFNWGAVNAPGASRRVVRYPSRAAALAAAAAHECGPDAFGYADSDSRGWYVTCFAGDRTHEASARRLVRTLAARAMPGRSFPLGALDAAGVSLGDLARAMWAQGYYTGNPRGDAAELVAQKTDNYAARLAESARAIAGALGEPLAPLGPTLALGVGFDGAGRSSTRPVGWLEVSPHPPTNAGAALVALALAWSLSP